jgi:hypothetical protein
MWRASFVEQSYPAATRYTLAWLIFSLLVFLQCVTVKPDRLWETVVKRRKA